MPMARVIKLTELPLCSFVRFRAQSAPPDIGNAEGLALAWRKQGWLLPFDNAPADIIARRGGPWSIDGGSSLEDLTLRGSIGGPPPFHFVIKDGWIEE